MLTQKLSPFRHRLTALLLLVDAGCLLWAAPGEFDVRAFGARGDGKSVDTAALQRALDACGRAGGGTVRLPAGTYLSQPLTLRSHTTLRLEAGAVLQATREPKDFMKTPGDWLKAGSSSAFIPLLGGSGLTDVAITGPGVIDGAGDVWWGAAEEARRRQPGYTLPRPRLVVLTRCTNVVVSGVTLRNSPSFHFVPTECENVRIEHVTVLAPEGAANTDALDPSLSRQVLITNCVLDVGDDNVAIKAGRPLAGRPFGCEDITIVHCLFRHGHGMSIGSETVGGVRNVRVADCRFEGTENGLRIKSPRGRGGWVENLVCENITMRDVQRALTITAYYPRIPPTDAAQPVSDTTPGFRRLRFKNLDATCYEDAGLVIGLPERPVEDVVLDNVRIRAARAGLEFRHVRAARLQNVTVTPGEGQPFRLTDAQVEGLP